MMTWPTGTFLHRLACEDRQELMRLGRRHRVDNGTVLLRMGAHGRTAIVLLHAFLKITVPTTNGREALLSIRIPGDIIGEVSAINNQPRTATATACGPGTVCVIRQEELQRFLASRPAATIELAGVVADRLRWANDRRVDAAAFAAPVRLARILSDMANHYGVRTRSGIEIGIGLTQSEISTLIGVSDITAQRALRNLRDRRLIETGYRQITVIDPDGLRRYSETTETTA